MSEDKATSKPKDLNEVLGDQIAQLSQFAWFAALVGGFLWAKQQVPTGPRGGWRKVADTVQIPLNWAIVDGPIWWKARVRTLKITACLWGLFEFVLMPWIMLHIGYTQADIFTKAKAEFICVIVLVIGWIIASVLNLKAVALAGVVAALIKGAPTVDWQSLILADRLDFGKNTANPEFSSNLKTHIQERGATFMNGVQGLQSAFTYLLFQAPNRILFWVCMAAVDLAVLPHVYHKAFFFIGLLCLSIVLSGLLAHSGEKRPPAFRYAGRLAGGFLVFVQPIWTLTIPVAGWVLRYQLLTPLGITIENATPNLQLIAAVSAIWAEMEFGVFPFLKSEALAKTVRTGAAGLLFLALVLFVASGAIEQQGWTSIIWWTAVAILTVGAFAALLTKRVGAAIVLAALAVGIVWYLRQPPHDAGRQQTMQTGSAVRSSQRTTPAPTPAGRDGVVRTASVVDTVTRTEHVVVTVKATMQPLKVRAHGRTTFPKGTVVRVRREPGGVIDLDPDRKAPTVGLVNDRSTGPTAQQAFVPDYARACPVPDGIIGFPTVEVRKRAAIVPLQKVTYVLDGRSAVWVDTNMPRDDFLCWGVVTLRGVVGRTLRSFTPHPWRKEGYGSFTVHVWVTLPAPPTVVAPSSKHSSGRLLHQGAPAFSYPQGMVV